MARLRSRRQYGGSSASPVSKRWGHSPQKRINAAGPGAFVIARPAAVTEQSGAGPAPSEGQGKRPPPNRIIRRAYPRDFPNKSRRFVGHPDLRRPGGRREVRGPAALEGARVHRHGAAHARAVHRREHRDLLDGLRPRPQAAAVPCAHPDRRDLQQLPEGRTEPVSVQPRPVQRLQGEHLGLRVHRPLRHQHGHGRGDGISRAHPWGGLHGRDLRRPRDPADHRPVLHAEELPARTRTR